MCNLAGTFYAIDKECTHAGGPLSEGTIDGEEIECPWHQGRFSIKPDAVVGPPPNGRPGQLQCPSERRRCRGRDLSHWSGRA